MQVRAPPKCWLRRPPPPLVLRSRHTPPSQSQNLHLSAATQSARQAVAVLAPVSPVTAATKHTKKRSHGHTDITAHGLWAPAVVLSRTINHVAVVILFVATYLYDGRIH